MSKTGQAVLIIVICAILAVLLIILTPIGRSMWNEWMHDVQTADDATNYETRKQVEDTCRAMIASYEADRMTYEQYKDSSITEQRQAPMSVAITGLGVLEDKEEKCASGNMMCGIS